MSSVLGVACVVAVLGVAANLMLGLWTRSTVDAVAYDAARDIATAPADRPTAAVAQRVLSEARASLGRYGSQVDMSLERADDEVVVVRVRAPGVELMPAMVDGGPTVGAMDRRIVLRREVP